MDNEKINRFETQDNFITEKMDIIKNDLLGTYDDNGRYNIAPQIVNELISLKKSRKSSYENSMFCVGNLLGYGEITFEIYCDKSNVDMSGNVMVQLFVLEAVDKVNGYLQNTIRTKIYEFSSQVNTFYDESYNKFNIVNSDAEDEGREKKTLDDFELDDNSYILAKKAYTDLLEKLSDEKVLDAYGKYFTARLSLLSKLDNEFSNTVLSLFNDKYNLIENIFLKDKNYKALNELLDSCFEQISGTKEVFIAQENDYRAKMADVLNIFTESVGRLNDSNEQKALNMLDKSDREKLTEMNDSVEKPSIDDQDVEGNFSDDNSYNADAESFEDNEQTELVDDFDNPVLLDEIAEEDEVESEPIENSVESSNANMQEEISADEPQNFGFDEEPASLEETAEKPQPSILSQIASMQQSSFTEENNNFNQNYNMQGFNQDLTKTSMFDEIKSMQDTNTQDTIQPTETVFDYLRSRGKTMSQSNAMSENNQPIENVWDTQGMKTTSVQNEPNTDINFDTYRENRVQSNLSNLEKLKSMRQSINESWKPNTTQEVNTDVSSSISQNSQFAENTTINPIETNGMNNTQNNTYYTPFEASKPNPMGQNFEANYSQNTQSMFDNSQQTMTNETQDVVTDSSKTDIANTKQEELSSNDKENDNDDLNLGSLDLNSKLESFFNNDGMNR